MAREAVLEMNCGRYSTEIIDIISLLDKVGWKWRSENNKVEYLSVADNGEYNWQKRELFESDLFELICKKQKRNEMIGVNLFRQNSPEGITLLAKSTKEILISMSVNRKTKDGNRESITDIGWYMTNLIEKLVKNGCQVDYIKFEDYTD